MKSNFPSCSFPSTLYTVTLEEGHILARQLAMRALGEQNYATAAAYLRSASPPSLEVLTALYFQTVAAANASWGAARSAPVSG